MSARKNAASANGWVARGRAAIPRIQTMRQRMVAEGEVDPDGVPTAGILAEDLAELLGDGAVEHYGWVWIGPKKHDYKEHAWVLCPDETIIDGAADAFRSAPRIRPSSWPIVVLTPSSPFFRRHYRGAEEDIPF